MTKPQGRLLLVALVAIVVISLWRATSVEQQKRQIAKAYDEAKQVLAQLETDRGRLSEELERAGRTMSAQATDLQALQQELSRVEGEMQQTVSELAILHQEHAQLREQNTSLASQLSSVTTEKQQLEARLSSLKELRLAIRDVKRKVWEDQWATWRARVQAQREEDQRRLASGNRGYLVRDGVTTLGSEVRLRVHVREPQAAQ